MMKIDSDFRLTKTTLNMADGNAYANNEPDRCPNCDIPMWRVTWEEEAGEAYKVTESQMERALKAEAACREKEDERVALWNKCRDLEGSLIVASAALHELRAERDQLQAKLDGVIKCLEDEASTNMARSKTCSDDMVDEFCDRSQYFREAADYVRGFLASAPQPEPASICSACNGESKGCTGEHRCLHCNGTGQEPDEWIGTSGKAYVNSHAAHKHHPLCSVQKGGSCDYDCARDYTSPQPEQKVQGEGGEPVAYMVNGRAFSAEAMRGKTISEGDAVTPLYAHPPAPASVAGEPEQITAPRCTICGTCAPEGFAKDCNRPPFNFDRYINGVLMAEGVWVEKADTLDAAMVIASRIASRGSDGEVPVLVYRPCAPAPVEAGALDQMVRRSVMASAELGKWLSSALDEPSVCDEMKADIREWFSAGEPELVQYARAALSQPTRERRGVRVLSAIPITFSDAAAYVREHHRHHTPPAGHKFSIAAVEGDEIVGVVIVGRPVARRRDDGRTLEVTRLCTNGHRNACSFLYGRAARAAFALGYQRIGTYILKSEPGTSLKAAGWKMIAETPGRSWSVPSRPRDDKHPIEPKLLWEVCA